jgi:hypothetical protein
MDEVVDLGLLLSALLRQPEGADQQEQPDAQVRGEEDRQRPGERRLAPLR